MIKRSSLIHEIAGMLIGHYIFVFEYFEYIGNSDYFFRFNIMEMYEIHISDTERSNKIL